MLQKFFWIIIVLVTMLNLNGCGGGGGSTPQEPTACKDETWAPSTDTVALFDPMEQTSNCGNKRPAVGTWDKLKNRPEPSAAPIFRNFSGALWHLKITGDNIGGLIAFGSSSNSKNNLGVLKMIDSSGTDLWTQQTTTPLNTRLESYGVTSDGNKIIQDYVIFTNQGDAMFYRKGFDMSGNSIFAENNSGYGLQSIISIINGNMLLAGRVAPGTPLPPPFPYSQTQLMYQDMTGTVPDVTIQPAIEPWHMSIDSTGIFIANQNTYMKYGFDGSILIPPTPWYPTGTNVLIHDVKTAGDKTYITGSVDGFVRLTQIGDPAFRNANAFDIEVGTSRIQLAVDQFGNLLVQIGNRLARVDMITGDILTRRHPVSVPDNADLVTSGAKAYWVSNSNVTYTLPLDQIPSE